MGTVYESHFAITFVELGLIGLIMWYVPIMIYCYRIYRYSNSHKLLVLALMGAYLTNIFINKSYNVVALLILSMAVSLALKEKT